MLRLICRTANAELSADATSVWLMQEEPQAFVRTATEVVGEVIPDFSSQPEQVGFTDAEKLITALNEGRVITIADVKATIYPITDF